jgi:DNA-binding transcriptional MocR family regulator
MGRMENYKTKPKAELLTIRNEVQTRYDNFKSKKLQLDMSRGKPGSDQLDLSMEMMDILSSKEIAQSNNGFDCRNYGLLDGIEEAKELFANLFDVESSEIIIGENSSLSMMYDTIARAMSFGTTDKTLPWSKQDKIKFLCPSPGYDRHFAICQLFDIEMIIIDMLSDGPDMDAIKKYVESDPSVKGIWCVPKYSNPDGITYSDEKVKQLAKLKPAAEDFRILWDNAYAVHDLYDDTDELYNILAACKEYGNPDMVYMFGSTSKITFPGSGIAFMATSKKNIEHAKSSILIQTIGSNKMNQLRHVKFLKDVAGIKAHMKKHAQILRPKFNVVLDQLSKELEFTGLAEWNKPNGGYFISLNVLDNTAKKIVALASEAGIKLTPAGATFPYGKDPNDRNIRIAPTYPSIEELTQAIEVLCLCVKLCGIDQLLLEK